MKILLIIFTVILVLLAMVQIYSYNSRSNIESYPYTVVKKYHPFEIRNYEARLFTSVQLPTSDYKTSSRRGFSKLGGYIFGANDQNESIAMTSPVAMNMGDSVTVMFMVPKGYKKEDLPRPDDSDVTFVEEPAKTVAAITFGGWANDEKVEKYKQQLIQALDREEIAYKENFYFMGYNPPYDFIGRKNEVMVELEE